MMDIPELLGSSDRIVNPTYRKIPGSRTLSGRDIAAAVDAMEPWLYLRFTDGAFFSMCGTRPPKETTPDGAAYHTETCGRELRRVFNGAYQAVQEGLPVVIELARCWTRWPAVCKAVEKMTPRQRAATVMGPVLTRAVVDGSVFEILDALRGSPARKAWVAQAADRPVIEAAGMTFIEAQRPDAWEHIDELDGIVEAWARAAPVLLATTIGLPSRCLQWRRWGRSGVSLDLGSTADALAGRKTRSYLKRDGRSRIVSRQFSKWEQRDYG